MLSDLPIDMLFAFWVIASLLSGFVVLTVGLALHDRWSRRRPWRANLAFWLSFLLASVLALTLFGLGMRGAVLGLS